MLYDPKTRWGVYYVLQDLEVRRDLISKQLFETLRLGKTRAPKLQMSALGLYDSETRLAMT